MMNGGWLLDVHLTGILIPSLAPDTEYTFSVHAFDVYKQLSEPATLVYVPKDITLPSAPGNLRQSTPTASTVTLTWTRSTDDIGIHEYIIYNDHEHFDSTSATTYTANDLPPGRYSFDVCAIDLSGNASAPASIVVNIEDQELTTPGDGS
jgi:predicted phage tail protein